MDGQGGGFDNQNGGVATLEKPQDEHIKAVEAERTQKAITTAKLLLHESNYDYLPPMEHLASVTEEDFGEESGPTGLLRNNKMVHLAEQNGSGSIITRDEKGIVSVYRYEPDQPIFYTTLENKEEQPRDLSGKIIKYPNMHEITDPHELLEDLRLKLKETKAQPLPDAFNL